MNPKCSSRDDVHRDSAQQPKKRKRSAEAEGFERPSSSPPRRHGWADTTVTEELDHNSQPQPHTDGDDTSGPDTSSFMRDGGTHQPAGHEFGDSDQGGNESEQSADPEIQGPGIPTISSCGGESEPPQRDARENSQERTPQQSSGDAVSLTVAMRGHANSLQVVGYGMERQHTRTPNTLDNVLFIPTPQQATSAGATLDRAVPHSHQASMGPWPGTQFRAVNQWTTSSEQRGATGQKTGKKRHGDLPDRAGGNRLRHGHDSAASPNRSSPGISDAESLPDQFGGATFVQSKEIREVVLLAFSC
jgi:hypothetical protein